MAPRQPSRKALYIPFLLLLVVGVVWTFAWFWLRAEARERMDTGAAELRAAGYTVSWQDRTFGGYPFRLDANLEGFRIGEPSGWAIEAPSVRSEAFVYALDHWVAVAPEGVVLHRPIGGPLTIKGRALRACLKDLDGHPPRVEVEGADLTFIPANGAQPFLLRSAEKLNLHVRPGPRNQGAVLFQVEGARANLPGLLARVADDEPVAMNVELILSDMSAMQGHNWRTMAQRWSQAGGTATVRTASLTVGGAVLAANGGGLSVGPNGRVEGGLNLDLARAGGALSDISGGMIPPGASFGGATLTFEGGRTMLGPLPIAPAPRVY
ncbi:MAG TPA: DUF2125 domain-containing protein [Caulobacteraceae bacterium]|nr:DUF2125 domain-containing protein [Caulobacteraceae bacterium]